MTFTGTSWEMKEIRCGGPPNKYAIGKFAGRIDPALEEFQSVNHYEFDDGRQFDDVTVFRRIKCFGPADVAPPPRTPSEAATPTPQSRLSCDCGHP